eukprot:TRINITY_DN7192_c0_g1_i2.p1 TRINITY_DN7192_c0_g1~~TRINITY_DN7192_c0_g1_i2.p1  ORF type:complete len:331 (+),score=58.40 TRINITY_DN7192_c0_g1_i2:34-1026(+)
MTFQRKEIVSKGNKDIIIGDGDKAVFHFKTFRKDTENIVDDSRKMHLGPFELRIGKKFLLPVWEDAVKTMQIGEIARFYVDSHAIESYPQLASVLRRESSKKHDNEHGEGHDHHHHGHHGHSCASSVLASENKDLYELFATEVYFELELLSVEKAGAYTKDMWEMDTRERIHAIRQHKMDGNNMFKIKSYEAAIEHYSKAVAHIETIENNAKLPSSTIEADVIEEAGQLREACLLNLVASELPLKEYAAAVHHANMAIERGTQNPKAYFRRAQAHYARQRDLDKAFSDIKHALALAPADNAIRALLTKIEHAMAKQKKADKARYEKIFAV